MRLQNFHLPLPDDLYAKLRDEAERSRRPATALAREALERWLQERKKAEVAEAIAAYAAEHAGSSADLDEELETAAIEHLLSDRP